MSRVPVINSTGVVTYKDVTINFDVSNTGVLNMDPLDPTIIPSPSLITTGIKSGHYKDKRGNKYLLSGPSAIPNTTRTAWSLALVTGPDASQFSMSWVKGPVTGHPNVSSLKARNITSRAYSWGIVGAEDWVSTSFPFYKWGDNGYVVGVAQAANQVVFYLFSNLDDIVDDSVSLTLCTMAC